MPLSDFLFSFFTLIKDLIEGLFGIDGLPGLLNMGEDDYVLSYIFCFGGFAFFGFAILYFIFSFLRGD